MKHLVVAAVFDKVGEPNKNNRVYTEAALRNAIKAKPELIIVRQNENQPPYDELTLKDALGFANGPEIKDGSVYYQCHFIDKAICEAVANGSVSVRSSGMGSVDGSIVGDDYQISGLFITTDPA